MNKSLLPLLTLLSVSVSIAVNADVSIPTGMADGQVKWKVVEEQSDDFSNDTINEEIWDNAPRSLNVGAWTFVPENTFIADGKLNIAATQETHTRKFHDSCWDGKAGGKAKTTDRELYYKSGAIRTHAEGVYGFYEASIKGVKLFPGLSPAFWLYSDNHPYPDRKDKSKQYVDYSEIDIVELQQADWRSPTDVDGVNVMDHNLHARVEENGKIVWKRPKPNPDTQLLHYKAPFDPSVGFHTYAVENRPDKISWYVDGKLIGSQVNTWWHRPMHMIFSMGLRRQFIRYNPACQRADPNPKKIITKGFPEDATMQVEYVKTWQAQPSIWFTDIASLDNQPHSGENLSVSVGYHGGSNDHIIAGKNGGVTVKLVEKNATGIVETVGSAIDKSTVTDENKYAGTSLVSISLKGVTPSAELAKDHYYTLVAEFESTNGSVITSELNSKPVIITH